MSFADGTENADRKRQRLNSEQEEGQSTSNDNENENQTQVVAPQTWVPIRRARANATRIRPTESLPTTAESNEPATESIGKLIYISFVFFPQFYYISIALPKFSEFSSPLIRK